MDVIKPVELENMQNIAYSNSSEQIDLLIGGIKRYCKYDIWENHLSKRSDRDVNL